MTYTHQAKRPYAGSQPSISSYFAPSTSSSPSQHQTLTASPTTYSSIPTLPANIQSNLLQVGMRVRKSVPEGYKTGSVYSGFSLFSDSSSPISASSSYGLQGGSVSGGQEKPKPKTRPRAGARELTPFCGLLKVGGMAQQQWGIYSPNQGSSREGNGNGGWDPYAAEEGFADGEDGMEDEMPPWSSQGSVSTVSSVEGATPVTPGGGNKRRYFEDEEEVVVFGGGLRDERVLGERVLAVPRRKKWVGGKIKTVAGQENVGIVGEDVDFDEAEFLDYGLIDEVEMGGC
ncbi:hypothetical protein L207DRAFT_520276 [Hyaloscypha variabilis F]|uniref:Uncharacterized protein n=1 Tax=Hyaloscypha variabilis (strain UAMH 11265 / GT02V1 / F) TaxID=1149755 RepID=A0A2J6QW27_HYAVF|nr:hypothetical protein L207DRAFT_520276 [Hyaloscypha variabilis F]